MIGNALLFFGGRCYPSSSCVIVHLTGERDKDGKNSEDDYDSCQNTAVKKLDRKHQRGCAGKNLDELDIARTTPVSQQKRRSRGGGRGYAKERRKERVKKRRVEWKSKLHRKQ